MDPKSFESMASEQLKKMIPQLLLSLSLFSFLFSYSSSLPHPHKSLSYFSENSLLLLSHALNKNCLFLLCNGLLVFLAKTSGFIRPPSPHDLNDVVLKKVSDSLQTALETYVLEDVAVHDQIPEEEQEEGGKDEADISPEEVAIFIEESEGEGGGGGGCDLVDDEEEKDENDQLKSKEFWLFDDDGDDLEKEYDDDDNDEEREEMSTEEMNQKFDEFIRRMKEEIIISEARQKVITFK